MMRLRPLTQTMYPAEARPAPNGPPEPRIWSDTPVFGHSASPVAELQASITRMAMGARMGVLSCFMVKLLLSVSSKSGTCAPPNLRRICDKRCLARAPAIVSGCADVSTAHASRSARSPNGRLCSRSTIGFVKRGSNRRRASPGGRPRRDPDARAHCHRPARSGRTSVWRLRPSRRVLKRAAVSRSLASSGLSNSR